MLVNLRTDCFLLVAVAIAILGNPWAFSPSYGQFELKSGDRVVLLGDGLIEQEQYFGWIEVMLTTAFPDADVTFRNLGWNADTPAGDSRFGLSLRQAGNEPKDEAWNLLVGQLELTRPTVVIFGYGMADALEASVAVADGDKKLGNQRLEKFRGDFVRLVETIREKDEKTRFVFLSPLRAVGESVLDDLMVDRATKIIRELATQSDSPFVDLRDVATENAHRKDPIHLNSDGYRVTASAIESALGVQPSGWAGSPMTESLREITLEKNRWWFHRSRPANMAYVFGFRKHEQGQNAVEIPQFDELIRREEKRIASRRGLRPSALSPRVKRLKSNVAEFTPQPHPDFTVADDLEVTLWAENPMLNKPIHMNFDPEGRLWVASSEAYPMIEVGQSPPDKILVLEDTTGDGRADKSTVFADGLLIPTGVAPGDGGVYVAQSTDLLFLKDTDGDGVADEKKRVLSGFGTEDTHHNLHTLVWGPDGRLYMNQSVYTRTDTETPYGLVRLKAGGGFRFHTTSGRMDVFFRGLWNSWGHQFDEWGNSFMTDGAGFAGLAYVFPGATFRPAPGSRQVLDLISPGRYPKFCSGEIIYGPSFPESWQGTMVTCDFRANRVTRFKLLDQGSGFVTEQADDLIRTSQSSFRPIDVKQGPDGALYVADWSNPIINHGEVDFRDPRRDRWHGRIWRIAVKDAAKKPKQNLRELETNVLLGNLLAPDRYTRDQSRRVLIERGDSILPSWTQWLAKLKSDGQKLQALWLAQAVGHVDIELLTSLVLSSDRDVQVAAIRVLADWSDPRNPLPKKLDRQFALGLLDSNLGGQPRARLESIRGLAKLRDVDAAVAALRSLGYQRDRFIDYALYLLVNEHADGLVAKMIRGELTDKALGLTTSGSNPTGIQARGQEFVLTSVEPAKAKAFLDQLLDEGPMQRSGDKLPFDLIAKAGSKPQLEKLYRRTISGGLKTDSVGRALQALSDAQRQRKLRGLPAGRKPFEDLKPLIAGHRDDSIRRMAIRLMGDWKVGGGVASIAEIASGADENLNVRIQAVEALQRIGTGPAIETLQSLTGSDVDAAIRGQSVLALARSQPGMAAKPFFEVIESVDDIAQMVSMWRSMIGNKGAEAALVAAVPEKLNPQAARIGVQVARENGREMKSLIEALMPLTGDTITAAQWSPERQKEVVELVKTTGDPSRGELVYRREALQCTICHAIGGIGGKVGPDMTSLGASAPVDYIVESLYDPNAKIKENYHSVVILTEEGRVVTGIESGSTDEEIVLRDASNKEIRIAQADVVEKKPGKSLMPLGMLDRVPTQDQIDLISFLTQLGKPGPFDASRQNVARRVDALAGTHRLEQEGIEGVIEGKPVPKGRAFSPWKPLSVRLSGKIDKEQIQAATTPPPNISLVNVYLRTTIEIASTGKAKIEVSGAKKAKCWVDGQAIDAAANARTFEPELDAGKHLLLIQLDARELPDSVSLKSDDVAFVELEQ